MDIITIHALKNKYQKTKGSEECTQEEARQKRQGTYQQKWYHQIP